MEQANERAQPLSKHHRCTNTAFHKTGSIQIVGCYLKDMISSPLCFSFEKVVNVVFEPICPLKLNVPARIGRITAQGHTESKFCSSDEVFTNLGLVACYMLILHAHQASGD